MICFVLIYLGLVQYQIILFLAFIYHSIQFNLFNRNLSPKIWKLAWSLIGAVHEYGIILRIV